MNSLRVMGKYRNVVFCDIEEILALDKGLEFTFAKIRGRL